MVTDTSLERLISAINVKETAPNRIINGKAKSVMEHKRGKVRKVVENSRRSVVTPDHLAQTLNIVLYKSKQMLGVTNQHIIHMSVHPISIIYRTDHLNLLHKYISVRWDVDWMPSATK